jgi:DNA primase
MQPTKTDPAVEQASDSTQTLCDVTEAAAALFTDPLRRRAAVSYLQQRGIDASGLS